VSDTATDYAGYLHIDRLLELQQPLTAAHDEMLFIVVHQAYELWFRLIIWELEAARTSLDAGAAAPALDALRRVRGVVDVLLSQLGVLETMTPAGFMEFRDPLAPASGFQSQQFRDIARLLGDPPSGIWPAYLSCLAKNGHPVDTDAGRRLQQLAALHRAHPDAAGALLHALAESLLDIDEAFAVWRFRHALMAARLIGGRTGTGGSPGVAYLRSTLDTRHFPELWAMRDVL
jgi:tryptophan 2,3-dioxygenase